MPREKAWRFGERRYEHREDGSYAYGTPCGEYACDKDGKVLGHLNMTGLKPLYEKRGKSCYNCHYFKKTDEEMEYEKTCYYCAIGFTEDGTLGAWIHHKSEPESFDDTTEVLLNIPFDA
jgi:hypothetical protein